MTELQARGHAGKPIHAPAQNLSPHSPQAPHGLLFVLSPPNASYAHMHTVVLSFTHHSLSLKKNWSEDI